MEQLEAKKRATMIMQNEKVSKEIEEAISDTISSKEEYLEEYTDQIATGDCECLRNYLLDVAPELIYLLN